MFCFRGIFAQSVSWVGSSVVNPCLHGSGAGFLPALVHHDQSHIVIEQLQDFLMSDNLQMIKPTERLGLPQYLIYLFITSSAALDTPLAAHPVGALFLTYSLMLLSVSLPSWPLFLWCASSASYCSFTCESMFGSF